MRTNKPRFIYYVFGDDGVVRYVGCSVDPRARLVQHYYEVSTLTPGFHSIHPFGRWLLEKRSRGEAIHVCRVRKAAVRWELDEQIEIARLMDAGAPLLNVICELSQVRPPRRKMKRRTWERERESVDRFVSEWVEFRPGAACTYPRLFKAWNEVCGVSISEPVFYEFLRDRLGDNVAWGKNERGWRILKGATVRPTPLLRKQNPW